MFSFFFWEHIALIYYVTGVLISGVEHDVHFLKQKPVHFFFATFLLIRVTMFVYIGNLRPCTGLGSLYTLQKVFSLRLAFELGRGWVKIHLSSPFSLHLSLVLWYKLLTYCSLLVRYGIIYSGLWLKCLVWACFCLEVKMPNHTPWKGAVLLSAGQTYCMDSRGKTRFSQMAKTVLTYLESNHCFVVGIFWLGLVEW